MGRKKQCTNKVKSSANKTIVRGANPRMINGKLDTVQKDTDEIKRISKSKLPMILTVIGLIFTVSGVSVVWLINLFTCSPKK
ncbi:MAG: hypothetical protein HDR22_00935 [Lachnospiraceae bacterium]|nr:hypothetical protein [Lachnospiraceae bacterium]